MAKVVAIGEAMLELTGGPRDWRLSYAGDALNTAVHLARSGQQVRFLTALGTDPFSARMLSEWREVGLDTSLVLRNPLRHPGLYAVSLDGKGERSFTYWRDSSAARTMFDLPESAATLEKAAGCDLLYFSLITLAILPAAGRHAVFDLARTVRGHGGHVAFDNNYRSSLWQEPAMARAVCDEAIAVATIGLPTLEDEAAMGGAVSAVAVAEHWRQLGCGCVVVKLGEGGCELPSGVRVAPSSVIEPVDTSGAGDAFNAGFLSAIIEGRSLEASAAEGNDLAHWTIQHKGAIPPPRH